MLGILSGTKRVKYLDENIKSLDVRLTKEDIDQLSSAIPQDKVTFWGPEGDVNASLLCLRLSRNKAIFTTHVYTLAIDGGKRCLTPEPWKECKEDNVLYFMLQVSGSRTWGRCKNKLQVQRKNAWGTSMEAEMYPRPLPI